MLALCSVVLPVIWLKGTPGGGGPVMPASPYAYPVHQVLAADVPLPQPVGEAGLANAAIMMPPGCIEVVVACVECA